MTFWSDVLQSNNRQVLVGRAKKPARRDTMGTLLFGAGTLLGLFLGMLLLSLLSLAQKGDKF
jgi:hypothetical protein